MKLLIRWRYALLLFIPAVLIACASASLTSTPSKMGEPRRTDALCEPLDNIPRVSAQELKKMMDDGADIMVVDTLYPYSYTRGHIKGAINFPGTEVNKEPTILPRNKLLVLYCDCDCEETSADVAVHLVKDWGYKNVKVLKGGWTEWIKLGYPTEKGEKK